MGLHKNVTYLSSQFSADIKWHISCWVRGHCRGCSAPGSLVPKLSLVWFKTHAVLWMTRMLIVRATGTCFLDLHGQLPLCHLNSILRSVCWALEKWPSGTWGFRNLPVAPYHLWGQRQWLVSTLHTHTPALLVCNLILQWLSVGLPRLCVCLIKVNLNILWWLIELCPKTC